MAQMTERTSHSHPLFEQYSIDTLAQLLTGLYSREYLEHMDRGWQECRPRFRSVVARILGRPESELFYEAAS